MKKLFMIGDSILVGASETESGYGKYVKEYLGDRAEVYIAPDCARFTMYTLRLIGEWAKTAPTEEIDTVHWNNGLWDILRIEGDDVFTPLPVYLSTLERIYRRIRRHFPNARIVFALTTNCREEWAYEDYDRKNADIRAFNEAAAELLTRLGAEIDDLNSASEAIPDEHRKDWVHYLEPGSRTLAKAVIRSVYPEYSVKEE